MKNKQTAVEWLINEIRLQVSRSEKLDNLHKKAKTMEKEQIIQAYDNGGDHYTETGKAIWGKDYYNETYANDTTTGLPKENSKRRGWHY